MSFFNWPWNDNDQDESDNKDNKQYYEILGVDETATQKEIIRAYKKLVKEHVPDRYTDQTHKFQEKFRQIVKAYEILSNRKTREEYDQNGSIGLFSYSEKQVNITTTLEEAFNGIKNRKITLYQKKLYENDFIVENDRLICSGFSKNCINTNNKSDGNLFIPEDIINKIYKFMHYYTLHNCSKCKGTGIVEVTKRMGPMVLQQKEACKSCDGEGGTDIRTINVTETIDIPIGMNKLYVLAKNEQFIPIAYAICIKWKKHNAYETNIDGQKENLGIKCDLGLKQALLGFNSNLIKIKHLNGKLLTLNIESLWDKVIQPDACFVVKGYGMPYANSDGDIKCGDLTIKFNVRLPEYKSQVMEFCDNFNVEESDNGDDIVFVKPSFGGCSF